MKLFLSVFILTCKIYASHISWYANYDKAHQEALKQGKFLLVFLIKEDCLTCKKMIADTFINQPYIDAINKKFVSVIITKTQKSSYPIELLYTLEYPTVFFLDKEELFIHKSVSGYIEPEKFNKIYESLP